MCKDKSMIELGKWNKVFNHMLKAMQTEDYWAMILHDKVAHYFPQFFNKTFYNMIM